MAADTAKSLVRDAKPGDYIARWSDESEPDEMVVDEARKLLRGRDLKLATDDIGVRVVDVAGAQS